MPHSCTGTGCTSDPVVQWGRRSATDPDAVDAVYACGAHAIELDLAGHVHAPDCLAPNAPNHPACNCTPEPLVPIQVADATTLPTGWVLPS